MKSLPTRPNILWYCTDQQRYDTIAALGYPGVVTPVVDGLVRGGVAFEKAYCQAPICTPSRASFLTGCYPSTVHINRNGNERMADRPPLVTRMLADAGYDCGLIGKLHLASAFKRVEPRVDDGYRYFKWSQAPRDEWEQHDYADWVHGKGAVLKELTQDLDGVPPELHQTTWASERAMEFISEARSGPWLLSVNIYDPHEPFNPPKRYRDQFDPKKMPDPLFRESDLAQQAKLATVDFSSNAARPEALDILHPILPSQRLPGATFANKEPTPGARDAWSLKAAYYAMIKLVDDQFARILERLEETGQRDNTVVIFTSDHGEALGDHGLIRKGCRFYEGLTRVPLVWSWPGVFEQGLVSSGLVELMDIAPTLLDLSGLPIPGHVQGRSLVPILTGRADPATFREFVRCEYYDATDKENATYGTMYRDERFKCVLYHRQNTGELYDLQEDPGEFTNLWDDPEHFALRAELVQKNFNASMLIMDQYSPRIGPM